MSGLFQVTGRRAAAMLLVAFAAACALALACVTPALAEDLTAGSWDDSVAAQADDADAIPMTAAAAGKSMYRLYNPYSGEHFYTADSKERDNVVKAGWYNEGIGWTAPTSGNKVFRLYNKYAGEHHYTTDSKERDTLVKAGWNDEGVGWYSDKNKAVKVYREYNPNAFACNHNYTTNKSEHDKLVKLGWRDEGIAWYGIVADSAALTESQLRSAVAAKTSNSILFFYYEDYDADGVKEAFAITGKKPTDSLSQWKSGVLWFVDSHGNVKKVVDQSSSWSNMGNQTNGVVRDLRGTGYVFLSLESNGGGSGTSSRVFGVKNGSPVKMTFSYTDAGTPKTGTVGYFHNDSQGNLTGYTSYFGNGYHQYIDHNFALNLSSFTFKQTWESRPKW